MRLVAVDPGRYYGWAYAECGLIVACGTCTELAELPTAPFAIVEMPRVYPNPAKWRGDPQDVVRTAYRAGLVAARYRHSVLVEPKRWRGGAPERIVRQHTRYRLDPTERSTLLGSAISAHAWDAIGMLCWALRRPIYR